MHAQEHVEHKTSVSPFEIAYNFTQTYIHIIGEEPQINAYLDTFKVLIFKRIAGKIIQLFNITLVDIEGY